MANHTTRSTSRSPTHPTKNQCCTTTPTHPCLAPHAQSMAITSTHPAKSDSDHEPPLNQHQTHFPTNAYPTQPPPQQTGQLLPYITNHSTHHSCTPQLHIGPFFFVHAACTYCALIGSHGRLTFACHSVTLVTHHSLLRGRTAFFVHNRCTHCTSVGQAVQAPICPALTTPASWTFI